uniref:Methionine--tRNA ligase, mitochondrial n=1 Tax=Daphnia lumholtzi TaxID=42856 RepID=A0A4Y7MFQ1_9CRUS|nr:EOG090X05VD [Daphnia lumholtzi]
MALINRTMYVNCRVFSDVMTTGCRTALLEIQYFVARDFRLDSQLYAQCKSDAAQFCNAAPNWTEEANAIGPQRNPLVLPCLYRYAYHPPADSSLKPECADEVRRVMRQRANSVDLIPEVEEPCIEDLASICFEKTGRGEEMQCLQDNLERLSPVCKQQVSNYTEEEAEHLELNPFITTYCSRFLETHCQDEMDDGDEGQVMECLVEYKMNTETTMNSKCRAAVEHFQLIALQDFRFSAHFKRACKLDISRLCPNIKAKPQVVACLSEMVRNDSVAQSLGVRSGNHVGSQHRVSQPCRQQLRNQLLQQHEDVQFNPNVQPHIGHIYTAVIADSSARFNRLIGNPVTFSTGTDEHGLKIQQAALCANNEPGQFCDHVSGLFRTALKNCEISYTDYIRTTESRHKENVHAFWETLSEKGYIYKGKYEGWYCTADEAFVAEDQTTLMKLPNGQEQRVSMESNRPVEWFSEENYLFKLSKLREELRRWLKSGPAVIRPLRHYNLVKSWLDQELIDLSVSRPNSRLSWGIPVPGDSSQTIYVWLDALLNYMTVAKHSQSEMNIWPPSVHVIGKDILKFHGIYWPAFLLAAGFEPPKSLLVHGHWLVDEQKMSKTTGNVVSPQSCINLVTATGLRYFLMHEGVPASDGNFSTKRMVRIANSDLADGIGNLVSRCCGKSLNPLQMRLGVSPSSFESCGSPGSDLLSLLERTPDIVHNEYQQWNFYKGIDQVMALVRGANGFFQTMEPWKLKKEGELDKLNATMAVTMETARVVGTLLQPIVPSYSERLLDKLGVPQEDRNWDFARLRWNTTETALGSQPAVLFPRIKSE